MKPKKESENKVTSYLEASIPQDTKIVPHVIEIGEVVYIGDGICKIKGLSNARIDDMIKIEAKGEEVNALILGINQDLVESVVLGDFTKISKGDIVKSSRKRVTVPVGEGVLGRVINPIGKPLDGKGELGPHKSAPIEVPAPPVNAREQIKEQIRTGVLVIDSIIPVGRGQRELVIGDRKTGKTTLMTNIINNQKGKDIACIYVSIGGKKAKVKGIIESLEASGAMEYTTVVLATADDPPSLNYIAPYAGCSIGEYFMKQGKNALIIYDDLSKQAKSYRQMSLLLKRSPGRDAYPGDIFFLHSRLLERSARLSKEFGGGSLTAFPLAETQSGDVSEYITTNLMSITDGHIYVDSHLMHAGIFPAVDSGTSVSRIGGSVQTKLLRKLSEVAASQLQRYNEVKSYENINTEITEETEREIKRGKRMLEICNQLSAVSYSLEEEIVFLFIVTQGKTDDIELNDLKKIKKELLKLLRTDAYKELRDKIGSPDVGFDDVNDELDKIFTPDFLQSLAATETKQEIDKQEKKELNKEGIQTPVDLNTKRSGVPVGVVAPQNPSSPSLEASTNTPVTPISTEKIAPPTPREEEKVQIKVHKEPPITELGEVINNIPEEEPNIKVINV